MADIVTYADLKFGDIVLKEAKHDGSAPEDQAEDWDIMYENVDGLQLPKEQRERRPPPTPITGIRKRSPFLCLVLVLLCLILSAAVITLAMTYIQTSGDLQHVESSYRTGSVRLSQHLRSVENLLESARKELEDTKADLRRAMKSNKDLNSTLLQSQWNADSCMTSRRATEERLRDIRADLDQSKADAQNKKEMLVKANAKVEQWQREFCPQGWVLFKNKCLWFSEDKDTWKESRSDCERRDSNLIVVPMYDETLKDFLAERGEVFWVGKQWSQRTQWRWPDNYGYHEYKVSWRISHNKLMSYYDSPWWRHKWICERTLVLTSWKAASSRVELALWKTTFSCPTKTYDD